MYVMQYIHCKITDGLQLSGHGRMQTGKGREEMRVKRGGWRGEDKTGKERENGRKGWWEEHKRR